MENISDLSTLAKRFEYLQFKFGLNDRALGEIAGVAGQTIANIVNGITLDPKIGLINNIALNLKVNPTWIMLGQGEIMLDATPTLREKAMGVASEGWEEMKASVENLQSMLQSALRTNEMLVAQNRDLTLLAKN